MKVVTIQDTNILTPNKEHQNFVFTGIVIPSGTILYGTNKIISGLRRGKPFAYKLFVTDKNQIIYQNTIKPMETTEVTLGADASQTPTISLPTINPQKLHSSIKSDKEPIFSCISTEISKLGKLVFESLTTLNSKVFRASKQT